MRLCKICNLPKNDDEYQIHHYKLDIPIYRNQCKSCRNKVTNCSFTRRRQSDVVIKNKDNARKRAERKNPNKRAKFILEDSRRGDKKKNRDNDLSLDFIKESISKGCSYCGEKIINICLDRINNSKGHTKDNVVASCVRCNYIRNSMPYEAWLHIVPLVKDAYISGLFNNWKTRFW
jgi:hypothetical protein